MVFSGIPFVFFFLPVVLALYYVAPKSVKNYILLIFSLAFYAWGEPFYILLMIFTSFVSYIVSLLMSKYEKHKKQLLVASVVINIGFLLFFKYTNLFISTANSIFGLSAKLLSVTLPIGISFYTFQTMSYNIDVYRGDVIPEKNFFTYMTYVCMFPQLIAGPIVRYETVQSEMRVRTVSFDKFCDGMIWFLCGLFKKVLLGNTVGAIFDEISAVPAAQHSLVTLWIGILAYYFHIYFDFGGYSDMAIGMGKMLGFTFPKNFDYPMTAQSVTDFWRRWHMSLTTWFKDYVYIPLGGSRCEPWKKIRNILVVWTLTGLWHGASWNFLVWGLFFGILLVLEKNVWGKALSKAPRFVRHLYTTVLVTVGWAIFSLEDFGVMTSYIKRMFINGNIADGETLYYLIPVLPIFAVCTVFAIPTYPFLKEKFAKLENRPLKILVSVLAILFFVSMLILSVAMLVGNSYNPFLYFRF